MKKIFLLFITIFSFAVSATSQIQERYNTFILLSMPSNETEFTNIFKRSPSKAEMQNIKTLLNENMSKPNVYLVNKPEDLDNLLADLLKKWNDEELQKKYGGHYIPFPKIGFSIVGHNESGDFYFPNGKSSTLKDVEAKLKGYSAMFLSCNSKTYLPNSVTIDYKLTYNEAISIANDLDNIITMHCGDYMTMTPRKVAEKMVNNLNRTHKIKYTAKFLGAASGMSGTFLLLKQLDTDKVEPTSDSTRTKNNK